MWNFSLCKALAKCFVGGRERCHSGVGSEGIRIIVGGVACEGIRIIEGKKC